MKASEKGKNSTPVDSAPIETAIPAPAINLAPAEIALSLDEFCQRLSETERRAALLGAFHFEMKRQHRLSGLFSEYRAAYEKFINAPA